MSIALTSAVVALEPDNLEYQMIYCLSHGESEKCAELGEEIVEWLIPEIQNENWKYHAIHALGEIGSYRAVEVLIDILNDDEYLDCQSSAINALGNIRAQAAARYLIPWLKNPDYHGRDLAARALVKIQDPNTVEEILELLTNDDENIQMTTVLALGWKGNHQAVQPLIEYHKSSGVVAKKRVLESLISIDMPSLENTFLEQLSDPDPEVQFMAAGALLEQGWEPDPTSAPPVFWAIKGNWEKLREFGPKAIPVLVEAWKQIEKDQSYDIFYALSANEEPLTELDQILVDMKPESVLPLLEVFEANRRFRLPLMRIMIAMKEEAAEHLLVLSAQSKDDDIRSISSQILRFGDHNIIFSIQKLTTHPEKILRQSAIKVLGWHPDPLSVEPVVKSLMQEEDPTVRGVAAETLGLIGGEAAAKALVQALQDSSDHVREVAVIALGKLKDPSTAEALITLLKDGNTNLRILAIRALGNIGGSQAREALEVLKTEGQDYTLNYELDQALKTITSQ
ncbi:MAG: HEAT repeat domain-containing protein [Anaerolineaceae bacterium]